MRTYGSRNPINPLSSGSYYKRVTRPLTITKPQVLILIHCTESAPPPHALVYD